MHSIFLTLRQRRQEMHLRQIDVGEIAGYVETQITRWESGRENPRFRALCDWCDALGLELTVKPKSESTNITFDGD